MFNYLVVSHVNQRCRRTWLTKVVRYVSQSNKQITSVEDSNDTEKTFDHLQSKILYSSYLESFGPRNNSWTNRIISGKIQRLEKDKRIIESNVQPFPLVLKYLDEQRFEGINSVEVNDIQNKNVDDIVEQDKRRYFIPYSQVQSVLEAVNEPSNVENEQKMKKWMNDYEYYDEDGEQESFYGTPDPNQPVSDVPCSGCGAHLHCADSGLPGYIPSEIFKGRHFRELTQIICQRCHFMRNYNTAINVTVTPEDYVKIIANIEDKKALAVLIVDLLDIENSIWPDIIDVLGRTRSIVVVGNKVDLLPRDAPGHLDHVRKCVYKAIVDAGFNENKILHVGLISATTGFGVEELITQLYKNWSNSGDVYIVGCTNVGKSSLFNALIQSDYCKSEASDILQRATASPWPGTTLKLLKFPILRPTGYRLHLRTERLKFQQKANAEEQRLRRMQANETKKIEYATLIGHIGRTYEQQKPSRDPFAFSQKNVTPTDFIIPVVNEKVEKYRDSRWCYDTPGVVQPEQVLNLLTTEELLKVIPKKMIVPRTFLFKRDHSLFLGGLGRVDYIEGILDSIRIQVYASKEIPTMLCKTEDSDELYNAFLGTKVLGVPFGSDERLAQWPELKASQPITVEGIDKSVNCCDLVVSSAGWFGVSIAKNFKATFRVWTPDGKGIVVRKPSLIPYGIQLRGKRIRHTFAYHQSKPFISFRK